ncbi:MAG: SCO family protein [Acetobacteraceae bacterium]|nr:SCO family protein [Acetobacteraceae bacterium]
MIRLLCLLLALALPARAADVSDLDWVQHQGAVLPMSAPLRDDSGHATTLAEVAGGLPLLLVPGYFKCPNLCGVIREDVFAAIAASGLQPGRDLAVALLTIDPAETVADASAARQSVLDRFPAARFAALTGPRSSLDAIAAAAGFRARFDPALKQFLHPAGLAIIAPTGEISSYLMGVGYAGEDLRAAVARADAGLTAPAEPVHLFCFTYDPHSGRVTVAVTEAVRAAGILTVLAIAGFIVHLSRRA